MPYNGHTFIDQTVTLDGELFDKCLFKGCTLSYSGGPVPQITNCTLEPPASWQFEGAAGRTLTFLRALANTNPISAVNFETMMASLGGNSSTDEPVESSQEPPRQTFDYLSSHAQHAIAIAKIEALFSSLEFQLCHVFAWMLQCYPTHAAAAYYQLQNHKARLDMIKGLIPVLHSEHERAAISQIIEKSQYCVRIRNRYCHALWQRKDNDLYITENLDTHYPYGTKRLVSVSTIIREAETVREYCDQIGKIFENLTAKRALVLAKEAIKPSYAPKFLEQSPRHDELENPKPAPESGEFDPSRRP